MNKTIFSQIRDVLIPRLDETAPTGTLSHEELVEIHALLQVLADDETCDFEACRQFVSRRTESQRGVLAEYRHALDLLSRTTNKMFGSKKYSDLSLADGDRVLRKILMRYEHPVQSSMWRQRGRLTGENLDVVFGRFTHRRFRQFVVRDLLLHYYSGAAGWSTVGYEEFPGYVRYEAEPCEVLGFEVEGDSISLRLSDGTFEKLAPETLRTDDEHGLVALAKSGRQRIMFERNTYYSFCELLEESEAGFILRIGDQAYEVSAHA
jgi:hypothetical protein